MEGLTASVSSTASVPRLRVTRHTTSLTSHQTEQGSLAHATALHPNSKRSAAYPDSQTSEDESGNIPLTGATSRLLSASLPPPDSSTQSNDTTHRLRALLSRFDTPARNPASTPRVAMPPSPSEHESDFDLRPAQVARASIKDLFQNAMREPGDTPPKPQFGRRASFNAVPSPKISKSRRRSTSDEEREILSRRPHGHRSDMSAAESLDRLRHQLTESMTSVQDVSSVSATSHPPSEALTATPQAATPHVPHLEPFRPVRGGEDGERHSSPRQISHTSIDPRQDRRAQSPTSAHSSSHMPLENESTAATNLIYPDESNHHRPSRSRTNSSQSRADRQEQDRNITILLLQYAIERLLKLYILR
ncbi:hypothetical protein JB92DRAFT_2058967 [Gautieria morchelliformis]|nr:hypothetical protein JB92DRAFT_2058967 [Gautieria morchelliformis]